MVISVHSLIAPSLLSASALQLALNLFDFLHFVCGDCEITGQDDVQHVNECVSRDVRQFSQHAYSPKDLNVALYIGNSPARNIEL
jgi:hypothetical protein